MTTARERPIQNLVFFERFGAEDAGASALVVGEEGFTGITEVQVPENGRFILIYRKDGKKRTKNREINGFFEKETDLGGESEIMEAFSVHPVNFTKNFLN